MPSQASPQGEFAERGLWRALTHLDGFHFSPDPQLTGQALKEFEKVMMDKSWRRLTEGELAIRVSAIFHAACSIYENDGTRRLDAAFYTALGKKTSNKRLVNYDIYKRIMGIYVNGFKGAAMGSAKHLHVDRRSAPAALGVSSWLEMTEGTFISITTKHPLKTEGNNGVSQEQPSRKRRAGPLDDNAVNEEIERHKARAIEMVQERDRACRELAGAKNQIRGLKKQVKETRSRCNIQDTKLQNMEEKIKTKTTEAAQEKAEKEKLYKAFKTVQRERQLALVTLTQQLHDDAEERIALARTERQNVVGELKIAKQERDRSQRKLAECAAAIRTLNTRLDVGSGDCVL